MIVGAVIAVGFWLLVVVLPIWCVCAAGADADRVAERAMIEQKHDFELGVLLADGWDVPAERKRGGEW